MTHKDAPPLAPEQQRFEAYWREHADPGVLGFGRDKHGKYLASFLRDAWDAWQAAGSIVDPLTVAYVALGAAEAKRASIKGLGSYTDTGGELDYIAEVIKHSPALAAAAAKIDEWSCVFMYEVAEPLGYEIGKALIDGTDIDVQECINTLIKDCAP